MLKISMTLCGPQLHNFVKAGNVAELRCNCIS